MLGVFPYGTEFDDPSEPSPYEFFKEKGSSFMKKSGNLIREIGTVLF